MNTGDTKKHSNPVWLVIPAAGIGSRMETDTPKQYLKINHKTLIEHTLDCFINHSEIAGIVVILNKDDSYWEKVDLTDFSKPIHTTVGGDNRSDSVLNGLAFLSNELNIENESWVMVHDAARPCLQKDDLDALLSIRDTSKIGGILASPVRDSMKHSSNQKKVITIEYSESRENLWHALTPQMFRLSDLMEALNICKAKHVSVTDESSAMEYIGHHPQIVMGNYNNIKVTQSSDIDLISFLLDTHRSLLEE